VTFRKQLECLPEQFTATSIEIEFPVFNALFGVSCELTTSEVELDVSKLPSVTLPNILHPVEHVNVVARLNPVVMDAFALGVFVFIVNSAFPSVVDLTGRAVWITRSEVFAGPTPLRNVEFIVSFILLGVVEVECMRTVQDSRCLVKYLLATAEERKAVPQIDFSIGRSVRRFRNESRHVVRNRYHDLVEV